MARIKNDLMYYAIAVVLGGLLSPLLYCIGLIIEYIIGVIGVLFGINGLPWSYGFFTPFRAWLIYCIIILVIMVLSWIEKGVGNQSQAKPIDPIIRHERSVQAYTKRLEEQRKEATEVALSETSKITNKSTIPHLSSAEKDNLLRDIAVEVNKWLKEKNYVQVGRSKAVWCLKHGYSLEVSLDVANHYTYKGEESRKSFVELSGAVVRKYLNA